MHGFTFHSHSHMTHSFGEGEKKKKSLRRLFTAERSLDVDRLLKSWTEEPGREQEGSEGVGWGWVGWRGWQSFRGVLWAKTREGEVECSQSSSFQIHKLNLLRSALHQHTLPNVREGGASHRSKKQNNNLYRTKNTLPKQVIKLKLSIDYLTPL